MAAPRLWLLASLALAHLASSAAGDDSADVCPAGGDCSVAGGKPRPSSKKYPWPHARGPSMGGGNSPHSFGEWPCDLKSKVAWSWTPPKGKYSNTGVQAPVIDDEMNLYVSIEDSIRKFSADGNLLWTFEMPPGHWLRRNPSIADGLLLTSSSTGFAFALTMDAGRLVWNVSVTETNCVGMDFGFVIAHDGVFFSDAECSDPLVHKMNKVYALNATDGSFLWDFRPEVGVWNFLPHFLDDGTVALQSWDGGVYHLRVKDGSLIWHHPGGGKDTWTDGGPVLGPGGLFYAVRSSAPQLHSPNGKPGFLDAYNLTDRSRMWSAALEQTPYTYPAVGHLREGGPLSVVTGVGSLGFLPLQLFVGLGVFLGALVCGPAIFLIWTAYACCCKSGNDGKSGKQKALGCCKRLCKRLCTAISVGIAVGLCGAGALTKWNFRHSVQAFNAVTGELLWRYDMPTWRWPCAAGDEAGFLPRTAAGHVPMCLPLASSYATLDAQGIFYMGHMDGRLYAIQDRNGDGHIEEESEVCTFDTGGSFSTQGPVLVPGLMAVGTCDSLFVFRK